MRHAPDHLTRSRGLLPWWSSPAYRRTSRGADVRVVYGCRCRYTPRSKPCASEAAKSPYADDDQARHAKPKPSVTKPKRSFEEVSRRAFHEKQRLMDAFTGCLACSVWLVVVGSFVLSVWGAYRLVTFIASWL